MKDRLIEMMNDAQRKLSRPPLADKGALGTAVEQLIGAIRGAKKRGIYQDHAIFPALAVVLDSMDEHRQALYAAVDLVNHLESTQDIHQIPKLITLFKQRAVKARLGQHVPRLSEEVDQAGGRPQ